MLKRYRFRNPSGFDSNAIYPEFGAGNGGEVGVAVALGMGVTVGRGVKVGGTFVKVAVGIRVGGTEVPVDEGMTGRAGYELAVARAIAVSSTDD